MLSVTRTSPYSVRYWAPYYRRSFHSSTRYMAQQTGKPNIIVVGGSYVGSWTAQFLSAAMHGTHKTILIEKNSHFQHLFTFPRFAVIPGYEHKSFVPFTDGMFAPAPPGSASVVNAEATEILPDKVVLSNGEPIDYEYLVLATGTKLSPPGTLKTRTKQEGIRYLQNHQSLISQASHITFIGGGAVGVQMATDTKDRYPEKSVTLIHSRTQLMNNFHMRLHEITFERCNELGIEVILGDRVKVPSEGFPTDPKSIFEIELTSGRRVTSNLAVVCTGQTPLSAPLRSLSPSSIDSDKGFVLVKPTLQIADTRYPNVFALGDVANTGGHKAARPGRTQAQIVSDNIAALASGVGELKTYTPDPAGIHLSLGIKANVIFSNPPLIGGEPVVNMKDNGTEDMRVDVVWNTKAPGVTDYYS